ncbi:hypothetical protein LZ32DRAFT_652239 [Colletotrichum eremochloae]|nr:hypothetical protein LZ32DRAFT_652239 [Colletotrichum eremochloae]
MRHIRSALSRTHQRTDEMEEIEPLRVMFFGSVLVAGLMAIFQIAGWLYNHLPKLLLAVKAAVSFEIPIYTLIAVPFFYFFVIAPIIRSFVPKATGGTESKRPSPTKTAPELSNEQRAAEARRCRLPGPVCESVRTRLESKTREVNELARELGEAEQRELDACDAAEASRNSHKLIRQRLDETEQQIVRYAPEANTIRKLEILLAESDKKVAEAEQRVAKGERLLKTEVEHSKWAIEKKEGQVRKLHKDMVKVVRTAKDRIGVLNSKINSLERELDTATRKDMSADVQVLLAEKDATIQFLTEVGLSVENDRDEKMSYAETMYASLQTGNETLRQQLSDLAEQTSRKNCEIRTLRDDLTNAQTQTQIAEAVSYEKEKKIDKLEKQLRKVTDESKTAMAHANDLVGKPRAKLSAAQEKMVSGVTKESIEGLKHQLEELRNQLTDAHSNHDRKMSQASAIHTEQQQYIESLRNDMNATCIENANMSEEISRIQGLLNQHAASDANTSAIEQRMATMQNQHQTDLNEAKSILDAKDGEIKHLQDSLAGMQKHIVSLQEEVDEMQGHVDDQDEHVDNLEQKLCKALINEKKAIERFNELENKKKKEAAADLLRYNRLKVEYNKATQERDKLLAGNQTDESKRLGDQLEISQLKEKIESITSKTGSNDAGANTSTEKQNKPQTNPKKTKIYTPDNRWKQRKALEIIGKVQLAEEMKDDDDDDDDDAEGRIQSDDEMETENTGGEEPMEDEAFESAMNEAIDESNREYSARTAAAFTTAIQAPGVTNPFAAPGPPATAHDFSAMFGRLGPMATVGGQAAGPPASLEKPATPESATERHLSGVTFWVPRKAPATTPTPHQQQEKQIDDGVEEPDTPAPMAGRKLKKPSPRRRQRAKELGDLSSVPQQ